MRGSRNLKRHRRRNRLVEILEQRHLLAGDVLANHGTPGSTGGYLSETVLTPARVASTQAANSITTNFGRLFDTTLDGQVYAQPLAVANVNVTRGASQGIHNVLYVATMHDSLYALDANTGAILWQDSFLQIADPRVTTIGSPAATTGTSTLPVLSGNNPIVNGSDIGPELGILATPTIDPATGILYLMATTQEFRTTNTATPAASGDKHFVERLWAVKLSDGSVAIAPTTNPAANIEPNSGGQIVGDTIMNSTSYSSYTGYHYVAGPFVKGSGDNGAFVAGTGDSAPVDGWSTDAAGVSTPWGSQGKTPMQAGFIPFNALLQMNRVATTLVNGEIYLGFASHGDNGPYYGWLLGYNATTLANNVAFVTVPTFEPFATVSGNRANFIAQAGFWASGGGITTDGTYLYITTGNGAFNPNTSNFNSTYASTDSGHTVQMPLDDDYGNAALKLQLDLNATQSNINLNTSSLHNSNGSYDPDGGYNANGYGLKVVDYFTPSNVFLLNQNDEDIGSGGVLLIPATGPGSATAPNGDPMLVTAGKEGRIYLLDANNLGGYNTQYITDGHEMANDDPAPYDRVLGEYYYYQANGHSTTFANNQTDKGYEIPSYFNGRFYIGLGDSSVSTLQAPEVGFNVANFPFTSTPHTGVQPSPSFTTANNFGGRGTTATISADGVNSGIIWNLVVQQAGTDALVAYSASANGTVSQIFNSNWTIIGQSTNTKDTLTNGVTNATGVKFSIPTVFNGMVYVGTGAGSGTGGHIQGTITGYGLLNVVLAAPSGLAAQAQSTSKIHLTWMRNTTSETEMVVERSLNGTTWTTLAYLPNGSTSYDDNAVVAGTQYFYRVKAISGASSSAYSNIALGNAPTYPRGDFNLDHAGNAADVPAMLQALTDLPSYQFSNSLSNADLSFLADVNGDQAINNIDLQALLTLVAGGGSQAANENIATEKLEPAPQFTAPSATLSKPTSDLAPSIGISLPVATPMAHSSGSIRLSHRVMIIGPLPIQGADSIRFSSATTAAVDHVLSISAQRTRLRRHVDFVDDFATDALLASN
jgi:hypothetical protein